MCWNVKISLLAAGCHLITLYFVHISRLTGPIKAGFVHFIVFYFIMEMFQALQWLTANPVDFDQAEGDCSQWNQVTTVFAYCLIWYQPYMFSYIADQKWTWLRIASVFTFCSTMIQILKPFIHEYLTEQCRSMILLPDTNYYGVTCTYIGKYGHLDWKFNIQNIAYYPTHFGYFLLVSISILHLHPVHKWTLGLGWFVSLLVTLFLVGFTPELPSFWCLLSVFVSPIIIFYLYLINRKNKKSSSICPC